MKQNESSHNQYVALIYTGMVSKVIIQSTGSAKYDVSTDYKTNLYDIETDRGKDESEIQVIQREREGLKEM